MTQNGFGSLVDFICCNCVMSREFKATFNASDPCKECKYTKTAGLFLRTA